MYVQTILLCMHELVPKEIITYKYIEMVYPVNIRSRSRSIRGYNRETGQQRTTRHPNPARGWMRGYLLWQYYRALRSLDLNNQDYRLVSQSIGYSKFSVRRWEIRLRPYWMSGGVVCTNLTGMDQMLLCIYFYIYPDVSADQIFTFIISNDGSTYLIQDIMLSCS